MKALADYVRCLIYSTFINFVYMVKGIPFKRMYCPDFFQTLHKCQPYIGHSETTMKRSGHHACFYPVCQYTYIGEVAMLYVHQDSDVQCKTRELP